MIVDVVDVVDVDVDVDVVVEVDVVVDVDVVDDVVVDIDVVDDVVVDVDVDVDVVDVVVDVVDVIVVDVDAKNEAKNIRSTSELDEERVFDTSKRSSPSDISFYRINWIFTSKRVENDHHPEM